MKNNTITLLLGILCLSVCTHAQVDAQADSLLQVLQTQQTPTTQKVTGTFASTRVINAQSVEMLQKGVLDFRILHRFGAVNNGFKDMFGLDVASMRMGFDYGLSNNLTIGIGRSTFLKEIDGFVKYRIAQQAQGKKEVPLSLVAVVGAVVNTLPLSETQQQLYGNAQRMAYFAQVLIAKKVNKNISVQLSPTILHRNLVQNDISNNMLSVGVGIRQKITPHSAIVIDAFPQLSGKVITDIMPLSIGIDIETGGHVFQLHFTNAVGMNEKAFLTQTTQQWQNGQFQFGFNLSRVFKVRH